MRLSTRRPSITGRVACDMDVDPEELRVLRRFVDGTRAMPIRDTLVVKRLLLQGLIVEVGENRSGTTYDLSEAGIDIIVAVDGPLTATELDAWRLERHARLGVDGQPQYCSRNSGWRRVHAPRVRSLLERWRTNGHRPTE